MVKLRKWRSLAVEGAFAAVLLAACATLVVRTFHATSSSGSGTPLSAALTDDGRTAATLQVLTGTPVLKIGVADLGASGRLLQVTTPGGGPAPQLRVDGADSGVIYLSAKDGSRDAAAVTVTLNSAVRWQLDLGGGTSQTAVDLRGGQLTGVAVSAGSDVIDLTLPRPRGSVPIRLAAGASQLLLRLPSGVPLRLTAHAGAGEVSLEGSTHVGVRSGTVLTTPGWAPGGNGFDVDAIKGAARITVTTWAS